MQSTLSAKKKPYSYNLGLKLWSTNDFYTEEALKLYEKGFYKYIELYVVPESFKNYIACWKNIEIPFVIHAPHFMNGMNLSDKNNWDKNRSLSLETIYFADELNADIIIFHPGVNGDIQETVRQILKINDSRVVIENKPFHALHNMGICVGYSPESIEFIIQSCGIGFCLDMGHAIYAANAAKENPLHYIDQFLSLNPKIVHLSDGDFSETVDQHRHLGDGNFSINKIVEKIKNHIPITLETPKDHRGSLADFIKDVSYLNQYGKI